LWIITAWQHILPEVSVEGVTRSAVYPVQWVNLMIIYCGMAVKRLEMLGVSVRKIKALTEGGDIDTGW
jgi:hypothetical protein